MTAANTYATPRRLSKTQRAVQTGLESVGLGGLDIRIGVTPVLDLPAGGLRAIAHRLWNPNAEPPAAETIAPVTETAAVAPSRDEMMAEARALQVRLGVLWVRENGSLKYGKATMREVTDTELALILAAARTGVAASGI